MAKTTTIRAPFHDEIAKTYLKTSANTRSAAKHRKESKLPWFIASAAIALAFFILLSRSNIDVRIRVLSELPSFTAVNEPDKFENVRDKGIFLVRGGELNTYIIRGENFTGDAVNFSEKTSDYIRLTNSRGSGWANYEIELKEPVDLSKLDLKYAAKGQRGDERLGIVIVDADNRYYRIEKDMASKLTTDWKMYTVNFRPVRKALDLSSIVLIKFEFGSLTVGNSSVSTIFLRDVYLAKTKKMRWL